MDFNTRIYETKRIISEANTYNKHFIRNVLEQLEKISENEVFTLPHPIFRSCYNKLTIKILDVIGYNNISDSVRNCLDYENFVLARCLIDAENLYFPVDFCSTLKTMIFWIRSWCTV